MPLLLCPNDETSMQTVQRAGVEFDMCPKCRGVWLDRGDLEKLMEAASREAQGYGGQPPRAPAPGYPPAAPGYAYGYGERGEHGERGERGEHGYAYGHGHKRKKHMDIFDIFS